MLSVNTARIVNGAIAIGHIKCPEHWDGRNVKDMSLSCCCLVRPLKTAMQAGKDSHELKRDDHQYKDDLIIIVKAIEKEQLLVFGVQLAAVISVICVVVVIVTWLFASVPDSTIIGIGVVAGMPVLGGGALYIYKCSICPKGPSQDAADRIAQLVYPIIEDEEK